MAMLEWHREDPQQQPVLFLRLAAAGDFHDPAEECKVSDLGKLRFVADDWSWSCCGAFHPEQHEQPTQG
ncbi:hypothetical protein CPLU01_09310 [Colletotrichum plurivorum]|uniref:Uncharacterized protein n=1 Tax=Colletotrichum plurivorum TaxID=2175906 RepID=A0A8H6K9P4_9PEZI|nr:hypothetical protein CPLU01_09310 [Colletotrichum plurivorum]